MARKMKALVVVTSNDKVGDTERKTGFYYEEMAIPYWALVDAGLEVDIASIKGGTAPYDPGSLGAEGARPAAVDRFLDDPVSVAKIENTLKIGNVDPLAYDLVFLPGGHGTMWDFAQSEALARVVGQAYDNEAVVGSVCHGPAGLISAKRADGNPLVQGLRVNSFTDAEEEAAGLTTVVPFLLETRLRQLGAKFEGAPNFTAKAVRDGRLVTGQNPQSAGVVAEDLLQALAERNQTAAEPR